MNRVLIVESGSSKADWLVLENGVSKLYFQSKGWNPLFLPEVDMIRRLNSYIDLNPFFATISRVYFYAPGCSHRASKCLLKRVLEGVFVGAVVHVESDLLAAARAVHHKTPLFVSILGTGSNTAFYDGEVLEQFTPSLGYIIGDEGSGASLGKALLKAYLYKKLPTDLHSEFSKKHSISKELVLKQVYKEEHPNRFLASYVPFLAEHKSHPYLIELIISEFEDYLNTHILSNPMCKDYSIAFVGSVAFYFQDLLSELCSKNNLSIASIVQSPIHNLKEYHMGVMDGRLTGNMA